MENQKKLSPEKYIITKSHDLPFYECYINENWQDSGMAAVMISKKMPSGKLIIGMYMVDVFCLGLKATSYRFALDEDGYEIFFSEIESRLGVLVNCDLVFAHNLIYGGIDYGEENGFKPPKDFNITEFLLNTDLIDGGIDEIEFGKDGKPYYFAGPYDNYKQIINVLEKKLGKGNFNYTVPQIS